MKLDLTFKENDQMFCLEFGQLQNLSDGGYEKGYAAGYDSGYAKGYADGEKVGYAQGEAHGRTVGYEQGKTDGHADGYAKGYADGYAAGYEAGQEFGYNKGHAEGYTEGETAGRETGYAEGHEVGYAEGKKAEYDAFWDEFQNNGGEVNYYYAFSYGKFNDTNYNPKYDIVCLSGAKTAANYVFYNSLITDTKVTIYANAKEASYMFAGNTKLHTIKKLVVHDGLTYVGTFSSCTSLENISFEGVIGKSIGFANSSLLSDASVQSIIDHLKDLTGATAQTLTFHATVGGKLTPEQKAAITAKNWTLVY